MPGAARVIDQCTGHIAAPPRPPVGTASIDVFVNGLPVLRMNDPYTVHGSPPHMGTIVGGSQTVFVNGLPAARVGDPIDCGSLIGAGSIDTFIG